MRDAIYYGRVIHHRMEPIQHQFEYQIAMLCVDVSNLTRKSWWFVRFRRKDYLTNYSGTLTEALQTIIKEKKGIDWQGKAYLIGCPSHFWYCYNPVVFFYCYDQNEKLQFIVAEIHNTPWGERYQYVIPCLDEVNNHHAFDKAFHISPFFSMNLKYDWSFVSEGESIKILMKLSFESETLFCVKVLLSSEKEFNLKKYFIGSPFRTHLTHFRIYVQAMKLYIKKAPFFSHPKYLKSEK